MDADFMPGNMREEEKIRSYWVILKYLIIDYFGTDILKDANPLFIVCDLQEDHQRWIIEFLWSGNESNMLDAEIRGSEYDIDT